MQFTAAFYDRETGLLIYEQLKSNGTILFVKTLRHMTNYKSRETIRGRRRNERFKIPNVVPALFSINETVDRTTGQRNKRHDQTNTCANKQALSTFVKSTTINNRVVINKFYQRREGDAK